MLYSNFVNTMSHDIRILDKYAKFSFDQSELPIELASTEGCYWFRNNLESSAIKEV